jgi:F0F1-type ATP synthase membrane subunit b/b'
MSTQEPGRAQPAPLTSLPRIEDVPFTDHGYDADQVRSAFDAFQRHVAQLQAQLRVLQAAGRSSMEPSGHAVRMDALHLIRSAAEFADALERDAQTASTTQLSRTEEEIRTRQMELRARESEVERFRQESERQRQEILGVARNESRELLANAQREASAELRDAEARGNKLLEQARHQATELTNAARAEVEGTLEWARAQAASIMTRAQQGAEQLLGAAGLGEDKVGRVADSLVQAADREAQSARSPGGVMRQATSMLQSSAAAAASSEEPKVEQPPMAAPPMATRPTIAEPEVEEADSEQTEEPRESEGLTPGAADSDEEDGPDEKDETDQEGPGGDEPRRYF